MIRIFQFSEFKVHFLFKLRPQRNNLVTGKQYICTKLDNEETFLMIYKKVKYNIKSQWIMKLLFIFILWAITPDRQSLTFSYSFCLASEKYWIFFFQLNYKVSSVFSVLGDYEKIILDIKVLRLFFYYFLYLSYIYSRLSYINRW